MMPEVGPEGQMKLKNSKVLVVGAGGLGIPASVYLAAAGVGKIGIVDNDSIEKSNLHRQTIYSEADIRRAKADVAGEKLRQVNPHISVTSMAVKLDSSNALDLIREYDVVLDCTDNFPARYLISDACAFLRKPDVYASVFRFDGQASIFYARDGPCYRCLYPEPPPPGAVQDCAEAGVLGVLPGIMGGIQAVQALNLIIGHGQSLVGRLLLFNASDMTLSELRIRKNQGCPVCGANPRITELVDYEAFCGTRLPAQPAEVGPVELKAMLTKGEKIVVLDVREPPEYDLCHLEGSKLIPLGELERRLAELDPAAKTVVYCHVGVRSARAVGILSSAGFKKAVNLKGGIRAWSEQVDSSIPVY